MRIAVIQASSQKDKNDILYSSVKAAVRDLGHEVMNLGVYKDEQHEYSYIETAFCISLLLAGNAVDFVVTGCSSGQGMMLACNMLPAVLCGYCKDPSDAYLFGRINDGNAVSFPLGLQYGWAGELNLQQTMNALFDGALGCGYPKEDAQRKQRDANAVKAWNQQVKRPMVEWLYEADFSLLQMARKRTPVYDVIMKHGTNHELQMILQTV